MFAFVLLGAVGWINKGYLVSPNPYGRDVLRYLNPGRLADVLALIQVLALDPMTHRSTAGIKTELLSDPTSGSSWIDIASEHPELFRVDRDKQHEISLISRHVSTTQLSADYVGKLMETAAILHDHQKKSSERWTYFIPLWVAAIGGVITLIVSAMHIFFNFSKA